MQHYKYWGDISLFEKAKILQTIRSIVSLTCGSDINVIFEGKKSFTDGKTIVLSADKDLKIDTLIGLALHEASHIKYTDFNPLYFKEYKTKLYKMFFNFVEDRRIDNLMMKNAPGHVNYYISLYYDFFQMPNQYFNLTDWNNISTWVRFMFMTPLFKIEKFDLNTLTDEQKQFYYLLHESIDLKTTKQSSEHAKKIIDFLESLNININDDIDEDLNDVQMKVNHEDKKQKLSDSEQTLLNTIASATDIDGDLNSIFVNDLRTKEEPSLYIDEGINYGAFLYKKIKHTNQTITETQTRLKNGKIDLKLVHEIKMDNFKIYKKTIISTPTPIHLHISLDKSSSMIGYKSNEQNKVVAAIASLVSKLKHIRLTVCLRYATSTTFTSYLVYDSLKNKLNDIHNINRKCKGSTPEAVLYPIEIKNVNTSKKPFYFITTTDGNPNDELLCLDIVNKIKKNHNIFAFLIGGDSFSNIYGSNGYNIDTSDFSRIATVLTKIISNVDIV